MNRILLILLALTGFLRAESEYIVEGIIEEIDHRGIHLNCEASDRIGYKRAYGLTIVINHPDQAKYQKGQVFKCFAWIAGLSGGEPPIIYKFSRRRK